MFCLAGKFSIGFSRPCKEPPLNMASAKRATAATSAAPAPAAKQARATGSDEFYVHCFKCDHFEQWVCCDTTCQSHSWRGSTKAHFMVCKKCGSDQELLCSECHDYMDLVPPAAGGDAPAAADPAHADICFSEIGDPENVDLPAWDPYMDLEEPAPRP